jgi:cysteinyl-tRNA synthetase
MTRSKETFKPISGNKVGLYTCGPTVYNYAHIGNFRAYVFEDLLRRTLEYFGYEVIHVMNLTDVDDKTIRGAKNAGVPLDDYTEPYKRAFFEDCAALGIERASIYPAATEHVQEMITLIQKLLDKDIAYKREDGSV